MNLHKPEINLVNVNESVPFYSINYGDSYVIFLILLSYACLVCAGAWITHSTDRQLSLFYRNRQLIGNMNEMCFNKKSKSWSSSWKRHKDINLLTTIRVMRWDGAKSILCYMPCIAFYVLFRFLAECGRVTTAVNRIARLLALFRRFSFLFDRSGSKEESCHCQTEHEILGNTFPLQQAHR